MSTIQNIFPQSFLYAYLFSPSEMKHIKHKELQWVIIFQNWHITMHSNIENFHHNRLY
jgi:hypothetical protein